MKALTVSYDSLTDAICYCYRGARALNSPLSKVISLYVASEASNFYIEVFAVKSEFWKVFGNASKKVWIFMF